MIAIRIESRKVRKLSKGYKVRRKGCSQSPKKPPLSHVIHEPVLEPVRTSSIEPLRAIALTCYQAPELKKRESGNEALL